MNAALNVEGEKGAQQRGWMIFCFASWFIPFLLSAFSDRSFSSPSGAMIHYVGQNSLAAAAIISAAAIVVFAKSLSYRKISAALLILMFLDLLITAFDSIGSSRGVAGMAIEGEPAELYRAMFWLPLFKIFGYTPSLSSLIYWGEISQKLLYMCIAPWLGSLHKPGEKPAPLKGSRKLIVYICVVFMSAICSIFIYNLYKHFDRLVGLRGDDLGERAAMAEFYERDYSVVPDSAETTEAKKMFDGGDHDGAVSLLKDAIKSGDGSAFVALAEIYENRDYEGYDFTTAHLLYRRGAANGNLHALSRFAREYAGSLKERTRLMEFAAELGDRSEENMSYLGAMYQFDHIFGNKADYAKSAKFFKLAAEAGSISGAWQTAGFYYRDYMEMRDLDEAERWAATAAASQRNDHRAPLFKEQAKLLLKRIETAKKRAGGK